MDASDEILAKIRRLPLQERLRLIERATSEAAEDTPETAVERPRKLSVDEFLAARLTPRPSVGPVSSEDMERAIAEGASGRGNARANSLLGLMSDEPELVDEVCSLAYEARTAHLRSR